MTFRHHCHQKALLFDNLCSGLQKAFLNLHDIYFGKYNYDVKVYYPDSVLKAAKKQGLSLPYSCEVGRCGNCLAKCVKGKVWHSYNEVLTDKELENGMVLTCVAHPVGGDIELKIGNA